MKLLGSVGVVMDLHGNRLSLLESQQRPWKLSVIGDRGNKALRRDLDRARGNPQDIIRGIGCGLTRGVSKIGQLRFRLETKGPRGNYPRTQDRSTCFQEVSPRCRWFPQFKPEQVTVKWRFGAEAENDCGRRTLITPKTLVRSAQSTSYIKSRRIKWQLRRPGSQDQNAEKQFKAHFSSCYWKTIDGRIIVVQVL